MNDHNKRNLSAKDFTIVIRHINKKKEIEDHSEDIKEFVE